jgi:hypothetical protein
MPRDKRIAFTERDDDGFWIYLAPGFRNMATETHAIVENTRTEAYRTHRSSTEPCPCKACDPPRTIPAGVGRP